MKNYIVVIKEVKEYRLLVEAESPSRAEEEAYNHEDFIRGISQELDATTERIMELTSVTIDDSE